MAEQVLMVELSLLGTVQIEDIEVEERLLEFGEVLQHLEVQAHSEANYPLFILFLLSFSPSCTADMLPKIIGNTKFSKLNKCVTLWTEDTASHLGR